MLTHFMCLLHHINRFSDSNNMNAYNLSVCVSPSIMKPPKDATTTQFEQTSGSCNVVTFLVENFIALFSQVGVSKYLIGKKQVGKK